MSHIRIHTHMEVDIIMATVGVITIMEVGITETVIVNEDGGINADAG